MTIYVRVSADDIFCVFFKILVFAYEILKQEKYLMFNISVGR